MTTATIMAEKDEDHQRKIFEYMIESFVKRWAPEGAHDNAQFHAELHSLVRQIYRDAQEPMLKHLTQLCATTLAPFGLPKL